MCIQLILDVYKRQGWLSYGATNYAWEHYQLKPAIETMWENSYKIVANCNNLVQNIANEEDVYKRQQVNGMFIGV